MLELTVVVSMESTHQRFACERTLDRDNTSGTKYMNVGGQTEEVNTMLLLDIWKLSV